MPAQGDLMTTPHTVLLLHGMRGSGKGSVSLLETELRALGWNETRFLRPTLPSVNLPGDRPLDEGYFRVALDEARGACPPEVDLVVGLSYGGLLAAFLDVPQRRSVCSPWNRLPGPVLQDLSARPGWAVLQGGKDTVVTPDHLEALPAQVPWKLDPEGSHQFDSWMDRIATWVAGGLPRVGIDNQG
jgi:hypothetical protein